MSQEQPEAEPEAEVIGVTKLRVGLDVEIDDVDLEHMIETEGGSEGAEVAFFEEIMKRFKDSVIKLHGIYVVNPNAEENKE